MTDDLRTWAEQIPPVTDRMLLEVVNNLTAAKAVVDDRSELSPIAGLIASLMGRERRGALLVERNLVQAQQAQLRWVAEIARRGTVTNLAVAKVAGHVQHVLGVATEAGRTATETAERLALLGEVVNELEQAVAERLKELDEWRKTVDLRQAAHVELESALADRKAGLAYSGVPWPYQVLLIARSLAGGACGELDQRVGDRTTAGLLAARLISDLLDAGTAQRLSVVSLLDDSWHTTPDAERRLLLAELLDVGLRPALGFPDCPLASTAAATMELSALPALARPESPALAALTMTDRRFGRQERSATLAGFVKRVVAEQWEASARVQAQIGWSG